MNRSMKKSVLALLLTGGAVAGGFAGTTLVENSRFAYAKDAVEASREELATAHDLSTVFRTVGHAVEPSVVQINVRKKVMGGGMRSLPFDDDALRKLFPDRDGDGKPDIPKGFPVPRGNGGDEEGGDDDSAYEQYGTGSGVIMEIQGKTAYILTNNHVAGGAEELFVTLADGRRLEGGKTIGADAKTDLAVVKIEADHLIPAKWGDSDKLEKGDWIMAFGSPFGYVGSMTHGIISALNRQAGILGSNGYENFIQVDAPINPGNSGGPLVNTFGEVVGINTAIASKSGSFSGIGFAIPSNQAKFVYAALKDKGKVTRGWLGVSISDVARDIPKAKSFGFDGEKGVLVEQTFANTPATGKLQPGDIVTEMNGKQIDNVQTLRNTVAATAPGTVLKMSVYREGKSQPVDITLGEQPEDPTLAVGRGGKPLPGNTAAPDKPAEAFGMKLATPTDELAQKFGLGEDSREGAVVTDVKSNSPAAKAGLRPGDLITQVQGQKVKSAKEAAAAIGKQDKSKGIRFYVEGADGKRFTFVEPVTK